MEYIQIPLPQFKLCPLMSYESTQQPKLHVRALTDYIAI